MVRHQNEHASNQDQCTAGDLMRFFTARDSEYWQTWWLGNIYPTMEYVGKLIEHTKPEAMLVLVNQWAKWIAIGCEPVLQELVASDISKRSESVQYLTAKLEEGLNKNSDREVMERLVYDAAIEAGESRTKLDESWKRPDAWENIMRTYTDRVKPQWEAGQLTVRRRIAQLLAEMSAKNSNAQPDTNQSKIVGELTKYAEGPLGRILVKEHDLEVRKSLACILANIKTDAAIYIMAVAVTGEERRNDTLTEYYLNPSQERSMNTENILKGVVKEARRTMKVFQVLNVLLFAVGLAVLIVGLFVSISSQDAATRWTGFGTAFGGFGAVMTYLIRNPLKNIQNGLVNSAEIETAFVSFVRELDLNDTYIQSQYLAHGELSQDDIARTVQRIEKARSSTIRFMDKYVDAKDEDQGGNANPAPPNGEQGNASATNQR